MRSASYHSLADHPSPRPSRNEIHAFEHDLTAAREKLLRLEEEAGPPREGDPFH